MKVKLIVATDKCSGISKNNKMPWYLKKDFQWFKFFTTHTIHPNKFNAVIMGRKTYESLPKRPLKSRLNIVLSKSHKFNSVPTFETYAEATQFLLNEDNIESIFIIGGESVYKQILDQFILDEIYITRIDYDYKCDQFFPEIPNNYNLIYESGIIAEGYSPDFKFQIYRSKEK